MSETYKLEKNYWTEKDFDAMGWHDSRIHGLSFDSNAENYKSDLCFDIDYIFSWLNPNQNDNYFTFWISPCTLIFHDVLKLKMNLDSEDFLSTELEISELRMNQKNQIQRNNYIKLRLRLILVLLHLRQLGMNNLFESIQNRQTNNGLI